MGLFVIVVLLAAALAKALALVYGVGLFADRLRARRDADRLAVVWGLERRRGESNDHLLQRVRLTRHRYQPGTRDYLTRCAAEAARCRVGDVQVIAGFGQVLVLLPDHVGDADVARAAYIIESTGVPVGVDLTVQRV